MLFCTFEERVDRFRSILKRLKENKKFLVEKSLEFKEISSEYEKKHEYFLKGNFFTKISDLVEKKYSLVKERYLLEINGLGKEQRSLFKGIDTILKKGNCYLELSLYEDFIPEDKFCRLVVDLTKAHKEGKINDEPLKKLKSYKEVVFEKGSVYVRDNRTQYSDIILINDKNEILFLIRNKNDDFCPGKYCLPGGHVEKNENFKAAAIRECKEETGIDIKFSEAIPCGNYIDSKSNIHYFTAKFNGDPVVLEEREQIQYEWVPIDDIKNKPLLMNLKEILEEVIDIPKCVLNSEHDSFDKYYFDGNTIIEDEDVLIQKSLDNLCERFNSGKTKFSELNSSFSEIDRPYERYYIKKGDDLRVFARLLDNIEKGKKANIGEVREWKGKKMRKTPQGWMPVTEGKTGESLTEDNKSEEESSTQKEYSSEELENFAKQTSTEDLNRAAEGSDEKLRVAAKKELQRREEEEAPKEKGDSEEDEKNEKNASDKENSNNKIEKGRKPDPIGTIKKWGNTYYKKTEDGWLSFKNEYIEGKGLSLPIQGADKLFEISLEITDFTDNLNPGQSREAISKFSKEYGITYSEAIKVIKGLAYDKTVNKEYSVGLDDKMGLYNLYIFKKKEDPIEDISKGEYKKLLENSLKDLEKLSIDEKSRLLSAFNSRTKSISFEEFRDSQLLDENSFIEKYPDSSKEEYRKYREDRDLLIKWGRDHKISLNNKVLYRYETDKENPLWSVPLGGSIEVKNIMGFSTEKDSFKTEKHPYLIKLITRRSDPLFLVPSKVENEILLAGNETLRIIEKTDNEISIRVF